MFTQQAEGRRIGLASLHPRSPRDRPGRREVGRDPRMLEKDRLQRGCRHRQTHTNPSGRKYVRFLLSEVLALAEKQEKEARGK